MLKPSPGWNPEATAALFAALGDTTRLQRVNRLGSGQTNSISGLSAGLKFNRQGVTKHLRVLENAGSIESPRMSQESPFSLRPKAVDPNQAVPRARLV